MRKFFSLFLTLALAAGLLAGCGNGTGSTAPDTAGDDVAANETAATEPAEGAAPTEDGDTIELQWAMWDEHLVPYYGPLIDAYTAQNPGVSIKLVDLGSSDYSTALTTQLSGGNNELDIISIKDLGNYVNLTNLGLLQPLTEYAGANGIDEEIFGGTIDQIRMGGEYYALPFRSDIWVVFYNKDVFDAAGLDYPTNDMTLDEYDALGRQLTSGSGSDKVYGLHYHTWQSVTQLFGILDGAHTMVDGDYQFLIPVYERILAQQNDGICMDYATLRTSSMHYSGVFENGEVGMMNMGSWYIAMIIESIANGETNIENWGMVQYPHPDGVDAGTTLGAVTLIGVNANSRYSEQALDFINFVSGEEGATILASTGTIPAITDSAVLEAITSMEGYPQDENSKAALNATQIYLEMPVHDFSAEIGEALNDANDNIMTENVSIVDGIAELEERVQGILNG